MTPRYPQFVRASAAAAALMLLASTQLFAQASAGADERPKMKLGPVEMRPKLQFNNIGVDNNVDNERDNPKKDFTFSAQPDMEMSIRPGRFRLIWQNGSELVWYQKYKDQRAMNRSSEWTLDADLTFMRPFVIYSSSHTSTRASAEVDLRARRHPRSISAGSAFRLATRTTGSFTWKDSREVYDENQTFRGQDLADTLNRKMRSMDVSVGLLLTPVTTFSLVVGRDNTTFDTASKRNSTSIRISPTFNFSPDGLISGSASVGYRKLDGSDETLPDYSGLTMSGGVVMLLGGRYRLDTRFTRDVQYSYEESLPYYVLTGGRATLASQLSNSIDARVTLGRDQMNYRAYVGEEAPGSDNMDVYGGGVGYMLGSRRRIIIQAEFTRRQSERDPLREFKNHRIFATLTWGG